MSPPARPLFRFLRCEVLKIATSRAVLICLVLPIAVSTVVALSLLSRSSLHVTGNGWGFFFQSIRAVWSLFALPALLALAAAFSLNLEHSNENWKLILCQPIPRSAIFWGKFLPLIGLVGISQLCLFVSAGVLGTSLGISGNLPLEELRIALWTIPATLPVLAFQFWLSLAWRSFFLPLGAGFFGAFVTLVTSQITIGSFRPAGLLPWSFPFRSLRLSGGSVQDPWLEMGMAILISLFLLWLAALHCAWAGQVRTGFLRSRTGLIRQGLPGLLLAAAIVILASAQTGNRKAVDWLRQHAVPVSVNPQQDDFSDLEAFGRAVATSRLVLLGEASHGDGRTFELKNRLVRYLHQKMNFQVLVFESSLYSCITAAEEILEGGDSTQWSRQALFPVWADSAQVEPVLTYLGETVASGAPLVLAGMDMQLSGSLAGARLRSDLRRFLGEDYPSELHSPDWQVLDRNLGLLLDHPQQWKNLPQPTRDGFLQAVRTISDRLEAGPNPAPKRRLVFWRQVLENLHELIAFLQILDPEDPASIEKAGPLRERQMARNLLWLANTFHAGKKLIVWGATSHLSRNRQLIESAPEARMVPLGHRVWQELPEQLYAVGFTSLEGVSGIPSEDPNRLRDIGSSPSRSLEDFFARAGLENAFLDFRTAGATAALKGPFVARPLGHSPLRAEWDQILDGIFFIRTMTPSNPVPLATR